MFTAPKSGYPKDLFVGESLWNYNECGLNFSEFMCGICLATCDDPMQCSNGHLFCSACIRPAITLKPQCPVCRVNLNNNNLSSNLLAKNIIRFILLFPLKNDSPWLRDLVVGNSVLNHNVCELKLSECMCGICLAVCNEPTQCSSGHLFCSTCIKSATAVNPQCPVCQIILNNENLSSNLLAKSIIRSLHIRCTAPTISDEDKCSWIGNLDNLEEHLRCCCYQSEKCTIPDCDLIMTRKSLSQHILTCPHSYTKCDYCNVDMKRKDLIAHMELCQYQPVRCTNHGCLEMMRLRDVSCHRKEKCIFEKVKCPLRKEGLCSVFCPKRLLRKDLGVHFCSRATMITLFMSDGEIKKSLYDKLVTAALDNDNEDLQRFLGVRKCKEPRASSAQLKNVTLKRDPEHLGDKELPHTKISKKSDRMETSSGADNDDSKYKVSEKDITDEVEYDLEVYLYLKDTTHYDPDDKAVFKCESIVAEDFGDGAEVVVFRSKFDVDTRAWCEVNMDDPIRVADVIAYHRNGEYRETMIAVLNRTV